MSVLTCASCKSAWRGFEYFEHKLVLSHIKVTDTVFTGKVNGTMDEPYTVTIDTAHPRRSICTCPHAASGRIVCKHMVALFFAVFPKEAAEYKAQIDAAIEEEEQYEEELENQVAEYIYSLTKEELRQLALDLISSLSDYEFDRFVRDYIE